MAERGARPDRPVVLVIDDDVHVRSVLGYALTDADFEVAQAGDGPAGIARAVELRPDVILLDSSMPGMSGHDVLDRLRADERTESIAVIMISGHGETQAKLDGFDAGANDYLVKPVSLQEMVARVSAQVRHRSGWLRRIDGALQARLQLSRDLAEVDQSASLPEMVEQVGTILGQHVHVDRCTLRVIGHDDDERGSERRRMDLGPWITEHGWAAVVHVPLRTGGAVFGELRVHTRHGVDETLSTLIDLAPQISALLATGAHADQRHERAREGVRALLRGGALHPVFQPIVSLDDRRTVGFEGLSRFGDVPPEQAFLAASRVGLSGELEVAAVSRILEASGGLPDGPYVAVNLSAATLLGTGIDDALATCSREVVVELTEHEHITDYAAVTARIATLPGVRLAIDDTGTGYASLRHVYELRPSVVKLDRTWVAGLERDPVRQAMIEALQGFTGVIGATVVGEGVERHEEAEALRSLGVALGQGNLFAPPDTAGSFADDGVPA
jgi:EAL domain-containing protein (putative c-di-GMP-specific phosphodiesterase class I)/DNA-binding response OmpR family regulator